MADATFDVNPLTLGRDWDTVRVGGKYPPGMVKLTGFERSFGWDVKKGKGQKGAVITLSEYPPAKGSIQIYVWEEAHFAQLNEFLEIFRYDESKKPAERRTTAIDIWHPSLDRVGVDSVVCEKLGPLVHEGKGLYSQKVDLLEYWPPPKKKDESTTPKGSKSDAGKKKTGASTDPIADAKQAEIKRLLDKAKEPG